MTKVNRFFDISPKKHSLTREALLCHSKLFNHVGLKNKFSEDQLLTKDKKNKLSQKHNHNIYGGLWRGKITRRQSVDTGDYLSVLLLC